MSMTHDRKRALTSWRISLSHLVIEEEIEKSITTTYRKKIWSQFIKGIKEFEMVQEGDKIAKYTNHNV